MDQGRTHQPREEMHEGLEHAPFLQRLYNGENTGKFKF